VSAVPGSAASRIGTPAPQYDAIAVAYQRSKRSPIRRYLEAYSFFGMLGDVAGRAVLDLACGEGFYSRQLRSRGARRVTGLDISPAMIELARGQEIGQEISQEIGKENHPARIDYRVGDARDLPDLGRFDVVCAAYLLHYARDAGELSRMCFGIARALRPGGRFVAINENPGQPEERYAGYLRYGFSKSVASPRHEGSPITYAMVSGRELFRFEVYHFERATYERQLAAAGFTDLRWHPVQLDPKGAAVMGDAYWAEYLGNPPIVGLSCRLAG
jgi:SAM-dependent methyltransferase